MHQRPTRVTWLVAGVLFAAFWASASTATKLGLTVAQPLVIAVMRFGIAAAVMLIIAHLLMGHRLPAGREWRHIALYGFLNISVYLGCYVVAMQTVTAGIGSLAVATNPVLISFLSLFILKQRPSAALVGALIVCSAGVVCASWPLLGNADVTTGGLVLLLFSMLSYSFAATYFSSREWAGLPILVINGWQTLLGGLFLLPLTLLFYDRQANVYNHTFWASVGWLAIPVSIFAVQLWLWLLQVNTVRAGLWLFLCPLFGFVFAAWWMKDVISGYTVVGCVLVIAGLGLSKINAARVNNVKGKDF